jgi:hypothetical protein
MLSKKFMLKKHRLVYRKNGRPAGNSRGLVMVDGKNYKTDYIIKLLCEEVFKPNHPFTLGDATTFNGAPVVIHSFNGAPGAEIIGEIKAGPHWSACQWSLAGACIDGKQEHQLTPQ